MSLVTDPGLRLLRESMLTNLQWKVNLYFLFALGDFKLISISLANWNFVEHVFEAFYTFGSDVQARTRNYYAVAIRARARVRSVS